MRLQLLRSCATFGAIDLSQHIARGPIPIDEALPIAKQIADALVILHEAKRGT